MLLTVPLRGAVHGSSGVLTSSLTDVSTRTLPLGNGLSGPQSGHVCLPARQAWHREPFLLVCSRVHQHSFPLEVRKEQWPFPRAPEPPSPRETASPPWEAAPRDGEGGSDSQGEGIPRVPECLEKAPLQRKALKWPRRLRSEVREQSRSVGRREQPVHCRGRPGGRCVPGRACV